MLQAGTSSSRSRRGIVLSPSSNTHYNNNASRKGSYSSSTSFRTVVDSQRVPARWMSSLSKRNTSITSVVDLKKFHFGGDSWRWRYGSSASAGGIRTSDTMVRNSNWLGLGIAASIAATMTFLWMDQSEAHAKVASEHMLEDDTIAAPPPKKVRKLFSKRGSMFTYQPSAKADIDKADALIKSGKFREALAVYNSLAAKEPKNPYYQYLKAKLFLASHKIDAAFDAAVKVADMAPSNPLVFLLLAEVEEHYGNYYYPDISNNALNALEYTNLSTTDIWRAYSFLVAPLGQENRLDQALDLAKTLLESANEFQNDPEIIARTYFGLAVAYMTSLSFNTAWSAICKYEDTIKTITDKNYKDPRRIQYICNKAFTLSMLNKVITGLDLLDEALKDDKNNPFYYFTSGLLYSQLDDAKAIEMYDKALVNGYPDEKLPLGNKCTSLYYLRRYYECMECFDDFLNHHAEVRVFREMRNLAAARINSLQEPARPITTRIQNKLLADEADLEDPEQREAHEIGMEALYEARKQDQWEMANNQLPGILYNTFHTNIDEFLEWMPTLESDIELPPIGKLDIPVAYPGVDDPYKVFLPKHFRPTSQELSELQYKRSLELQWREDLLEARPDDLKAMLKDIDFDAFGYSQPDYDENSSNFDDYMENIDPVLRKYYPRLPGDDEPPLDDLDDLQRWKDEQEYQKKISKVDDNDDDEDEDEEDDLIESEEENPLAITDKDDDTFRHFFSTKFALFDTELSGDELSPEDQKIFDELVMLYPKFRKRGIQPNNKHEMEMFDILIGVRDSDPVLYEKIVNPEKYRKLRESAEPPTFEPPEVDITEEAHVTREGMD